MVPVSVLQAVACAENLRELARRPGFRRYPDLRGDGQRGRLDEPHLVSNELRLETHGCRRCTPDYFAADGQLWGNPLYDWEKHKATNYAWWIARLRASFALYDVVRVDHFRGFDQYCKIPANAANAREYEWEPGPGIDLFETIKAEFPEARLVAEDLGIITDSVRALVEAVGVPGMKVLQFGFEGATEYLPHSGIPNSLLYPGTHDNDTSWGWFNKQSEPVKDFFRRYLRVQGDAVPWDMI